MHDVWECPVWHPGDCTGTPACPPRCPRFVTDTGTTLTVFSDDAGRLVAIGDDGRPLAGIDRDGDTALVELAEGTESAIGVEVIRQAIARGHEREDRQLVIEADQGVLDAIVPELGDALLDRDLGRLQVDPSHRDASPLTLAPARGTSTASVDRVDALVDPEVVAVFGATDREGSIGRVLLENLDSFDGTVLPVTDRHESLLGIPTVSTLDGHTVDLAVIVLPAEAVATAVDSAMAAGAGAVAILSAGFGEVDEAGGEREADLAARLRSGSVTAIGPNAIGVMSNRSGLNATFAPAMPAPGGLSIVSHSGAMMAAIVDWATATDIGVRDGVSLGNRIDLTASELVRYWGRDGETSVICAYLEDLPDGRAFVEAARDVTPTTPIVALKAGRTSAGAAAAQSHTGAIAGDDAGYEAAFDAAGVIRADGQDELFDLIDALTSVPVPLGEGVAVVTNAGGPGVIAADAVVESGLELADLEEVTVDRLIDSLPAAAGVGNPIDVLGDADVDRFVSAIESVMRDRHVDAVVVTSAPHPLVSLSDVVEAIDDLVARYGVPVAVSFPGVHDADLEAVLSASAVVSAPDAGRVAKTLAKLAWYGRNRRRPRAGIDPIGADESAITEAIEAARTDGRDTLGVPSLPLLEAYGVSIPTTQIVTTRSDCEEAVADIGEEAVVKLAVDDIAHKTEFGGVITGVSPAEAADRFDEVTASVQQSQSDDPVAVAVQDPIEGGVELLVGVTNHPRFGPIVTVGLGGVLVEVLEDVAHGLAPLSTDAAYALLTSLAGSSLLMEGPRGGVPPDLEAAADAIARLSRLAADHEPITTLEVNPLIATPDGAYAVDVFIELS